MSRFTNGDTLFGHKYFDSALQLSVLAKDAATVRTTEEPDLQEAARLYQCAVNDALAGIKEIESDPIWLDGHILTVRYMKGKIEEWRGELYTLPQPTNQR